MIAKSYEIQNDTKKFLNYNFFLLYGENQGLKKDIIKSINDSINKEDSKTEKISFYENEIIDNKEKLYNNIYSGSLFSSKKIIIINYGTDKIFKEIEDIVTKYPENVFIIILSEILEKKSKLRNFFEKDKKTLCVPCYLDLEKNLRYIAQNELRKNGINLSMESINLLIEKSNSDRQNLKTEIEKVIAFAKDKKLVSIEEIKAIVNFSGEHKTDIIINECLCGNISEYKKIISELYVGTINQIYLLRILNNKILKLLNMKKLEKDYKSLDNLLDSSKPPIFWKEKPMIKKQLSIWNLKDLTKIIYEVNEVEFQCKKNPQVSRLIFFNFFTKICKKASSFS